MAAVGSCCCNLKAARTVGTRYLRTVRSNGASWLTSSASLRLRRFSRPAGIKRQNQDQATSALIGRPWFWASIARRSGRTDEAERLADEVSQEAPLDLTVAGYLVPTVRAAVKLQQHDPTAASICSAGPSSTISQSPIVDYLYPAYIRGLAFLESGDGRSAAASSKS